MNTPTDTKTKEAEVVKTDPAVAKMQDMITQYKGHMAALLGKHMSVEQMYQVALLALGRVPKLKECTTASVLGCVLEASRLKLQAGTGPGETRLIPRKNKWTGKMECTMIVDYRAIIKMMKRDSGVNAVIAEAVHEGDTFEYGIDGKPFLKWKPNTGDRGPIKGYVAACWDQSDRLVGCIYKTKAEIEEISKKRSGTAETAISPWKSDPDWMFKKSVIRPLGKLNPGNGGSELQRAIALDERADLNLPQNLHLLADPTGTPDPEPTTEKPEMPKPAGESAGTDEPKEIQMSEFTLNDDAKTGRALVSGCGLILSTKNAEVKKSILQAITKKQKIKLVYFASATGPAEIETVEIVK